MNNDALSRATRFHGKRDTEIAYDFQRVVETGETKYFVIQERDLAYKFTLHQHPYVQALVQCLLRKGTTGLQDADTDYVDRTTSLPDSIQVSLAANTILSLPASSRITLVTNVTAATVSGQMSLEAGLSLKTNSAAPTRLLEPMQATLTDGMLNTPSSGDTFVPRPENRKAVVFRDTQIVLNTATQAIHPNGKLITLPAQSEVLLAKGTRIVLPDATPVTLIKSVRKPVLFEEFFAGGYMPNESVVQHPFPVKDLDFTSGGAYAVYNWELFFHVPITIAIHLSKNQRFAEAQRWFHYLFDPTDDSDGPTPDRFWKVRPFQSTDVRKIEEVLVNLVTAADPVLLEETISSIDAWKETPFRPHVIARFRQQAYMYKTVTAYLDNLIAWGDSLFRQDTGEAIDEALQLYVLAANILGPRPLPVPKKGTVRPQTYANLRQDLKQFGTVERDLESEFLIDAMPLPAEGQGDNAQLLTLNSLGKSLYFCVPRNDMLLRYWDTVADRLFKIRNSLNFQGIFRQLALFEPPIDPAMLARAAAAGLDIGAIVNGLSQPLPLVRFGFLVQKATEIVQEVKSLGNNLLSAMEKEDGEAMALLRAKHERVVMEMVEHVRYSQLQEAIKSREGLLQTLALAVQRYSYYERQLGKKPDEIEKAIPALNELDKDTLDKMKFSMEEPEVAAREINVDIAQDLGASGGKLVSSHEAEELEKSEEARTIYDVIKTLNLTAQGLSLIPDFGIDIHFWGLGGNSDVAGGTKLSQFARFGANIASAVSDRLNYEAGRAAKIGSYARREQDWSFQSNQAAGEINQIFKQLRAAQIREAIAELELKNHRQQMKHAEEIERFLNEEGTDKKGKKTNKALYAWMKREVKGLYAQCFQFAFDIAKKAERALQHELGNPQLSYLQFGYLAGKEGLLAGEKLYLDIKRMEMAYHEQNQREYELTKHVSLLQVDPLSLVQLRMTGRCTVRLEESLFDMDGPGHYFRRIKTVALSIPCVAGPYASVNCTLTLLKSTIRTTPVVGDQYAPLDAEDTRFSHYSGSLQSIVTSSAQNDSGLFETNLRDERYLPFENSGVISEWSLELPANPSLGDPAQFDYDTISDVILHVRYTAREGGGLLRKGAIANTKELIERGKALGSARLFSVRHEFPSEWAKFQRQSQVPVPNQRFSLTLNLRKEHFPFWSKKPLESIASVDLLARSTSNAVADKADTTDTSAKKDSFVKDPALGDLLITRLTNVKLPTNPLGSIPLFFDDMVTDLWILVTWTE